VQQQVQEIEAREGRKPGKKERRDLQDQVRGQLLPQAFSRLSDVTLWIDPVEQWLVLDVASQSRADDAVNCLVQSLPDITVLPWSTQVSPARAMADWLLGPESGGPFGLEQECVLQSADGTRSAVRYSRHRLDTDDVKEHIKLGKMPNRLGLNWQGRVSFVLTDSLQLKKLSFAEGVFEGAQQHSEDEFDANVAIATGELKRLLPDLELALGGLLAGADA